MGLPLIADGRKMGAALITYDQPRRFSPAEIALGEQAGAQVALAMAKAQSLQLQEQRTAELARANSIIMALGKVAASLEMVPDPQAVMETLGNELGRLGVHCMVALRQPKTDTFVLRYISLQSRLSKLADRLAEIDVNSYHAGSSCRSPQKRR
jgi:hypothetical protein